MSDNSNNVHFSGVRFICSPYLAIKSALASLGPIMARCGPQMNLTPSKWTLLLYCRIPQHFTVVDILTFKTSEESKLLFVCTWDWCYLTFTFNPVAGDWLRLDMQQKRFKCISMKESIFPIFPILRRNLFVGRAEKSVLAKIEKFWFFTFVPAWSFAHCLLHMQAA